MPLPTKKPFERKVDYLKRCIPVELVAGKTRAQAAAICSTTFDNFTENKNKN